MESTPVRWLILYCRTLLRCASWLVPRSKRGDWRRAWEGQVWHWCHFLHESGRLSPSTKYEVIRHCWGSFADAAWHRFNRELVLRRLHEWPRTPAFCLATIGTILLVVFITGFRPIQSGIFGAPTPKTRVLNITLNTGAPWLQPQLLHDWATKLAARPSSAQETAEYTYSPALLSGRGGRQWLLRARVSPELFQLLNAHPRLGRLFRREDIANCKNCVVLGHSVWTTEFAADPTIIGQSVLVDGHDYVVIGVLPLQFRFLSGQIGVFELLDPQQPEAPSPLRLTDWPGIVARVKAATKTEQITAELSALAQQSGHELDGVRAISLFEPGENQSAAKSYVWLFAGALLMVLLLVVADVIRAGSARTHIPKSWWTFFAAKSTLLVIIALGASLELVYYFGGGSGVDRDPLADTATIWLFLTVVIIALAWSIRDQRRRCRTCLKRLNVEVDVGTAATFLLDLTGKELVCPGGHGALHVPLMEASCIDSEQWTEMDESWRELFGDQEHAGPPSDGSE